MSKIKFCTFHTKLYKFVNVWMPFPNGLFSLCFRLHKLSHIWMNRVCPFVCSVDGRMTVNYFIINSPWFNFKVEKSHKHGYHHTRRFSGCKSSHHATIKRDKNFFLTFGGTIWNCKGFLASKWIRVLVLDGESKVIVVQRPHRMISGATSSWLHV